MPVLIGVAALGTEGAQVITLHREAQAAADSAAVSVASYYALAEDSASTADVNGAVEPGEGGSFNLRFRRRDERRLRGGEQSAGVGQFQPLHDVHYAFQAIVSQSHTPLLSGYWLKNAMTVSARAVALINYRVNGSSANCILSARQFSKQEANQLKLSRAKATAALNLMVQRRRTIRATPNSVYLAPKAPPRSTWRSQWSSRRPC